jgi:hypothetical protein
MTKQGNKCIITHALVHRVSAAVYMFEMTVHNDHAQTATSADPGGSSYHLITIVFMCIALPKKSDGELCHLFIYNVFHSKPAGLLDFAVQAGRF